MLRLKNISKDYFGAVLLLVLGTGVLVLGLDYRMGSLSRMGAGFIPVVLGTLMIAVAVAIAVTAAPAGQAAGAGAHGGHGGGDQEGAATGPEYRGWGCILGGVVAFVVFGEYGGLVPATFVSVFIAAMGDRNNTWKNAALVASVMVAFGVIVFHFGLSLQLPLFHWN